MHMTSDEKQNILWAKRAWGSQMTMLEESANSPVNFRFQRFVKIDFNLDMQI